MIILLVHGVGMGAGLAAVAIEIGDNLSTVSASVKKETTTASIERRTESKTIVKETKP